MIESEIEIRKYLSEIDKEIDFVDFNTYEKSLKYKLRFELGDKLENGTKETIIQATNRVTELFKTTFKNENSVYVISYEFEDEAFAFTPNYLFSLLENKKLELNQNIALRYFDNEEPEYYPGKLNVYLEKRQDLNITKIFGGIANTEMGFEPCIHQIVFFIGLETKKLFWMYDDRGCLVMSNSKNLDNILEFKNWLCEGYLEDYKNYR